MKRLLFLGVMVTLLSGCGTNSQERYEYYDFEGNYGTSIDCKSTSDDLVCKTDMGYVKVSQYSKINE